MKLYQFGPSKGRKITHFNSKGVVICGIVREIADGNLGCMYIEPNGVVGYHDATIDQLFMVVDGNGWVRGESGERSSIQAGQAAFWSAGEGHESGTEKGMTVLVLEAVDLHPENWMMLVGQKVSD